MPESETGGGEGVDARITAALASLVELVTSRTVQDTIPEGLEGNEDYLFLRRAIVEIRGAVMATASGDLAYPIALRGFLPGALKALQASLRHLTWQTQAIAAGDFSQKVEFMGDFSASFNSMVAQLEESVTKLKNSEQALWLAAHTDSLTGMKNRTWFFELFEETMASRDADVEDVAVIMFDVDHFKAVNDTYSHAAGDEALRMVARALSSLELRDMDYWGRLGGEEFALVLPHSGIDVAFATAERLRSALENSPVIYAGIAFAITVSVGVSMGRPGDSIESLLGRADSAMYHAKETGRNRVSGDEYE